MAYCDDDFGLLGDEAQSQPQQPFSAAHRYVGAKPASISHHHHLAATITSPVKKAVVVDGGGGEDHEGYGEAFGQTDASKCPAAPGFHDHHCFEDANPFAPQHPAADEDDADEDGGADNNPERKGAAASASHRNLHHQQLPHHIPPKRKDRDDLSDGESPYYNSSSAANKKSRPMSSSGDYRKDREEWSDTAIGSLLDAYTEKFVQLSRGNLRGRDWEDVATIVSERCNKQKAAKSVEQCKNKIDNLKKRYKVECQRLSGGGLPASHWPWFRKMEQLVGSSSSSSKAVLEDDKSVTLGGPASVVRQIKRYPVVTSGPVSLNNNTKMKSLSRWKRVILKISGMVLLDGGSQNVDPKVVMLIGKEIAIANRSGLEVAIVIGGRNLFCGEAWLSATGIDRSTINQIGMMASLMNAIMLQGSLEKLGVEARIHSTVMVQDVAEPYIRRRAIRHLEKGKVVIFVGAGAGTGNPLLSTDAAAALRASEIHADAVLKGTTADNLYNCHSRNSSGGAFEHISFRELIARGFTVMDITALNFCEENNIPVVLFNMLEPGNISKALCGDHVGTLIDQTGRIS